MFLDRIVAQMFDPGLQRRPGVSDVARKERGMATIGTRYAIRSMIAGATAAALIGAAENAAADGVMLTKAPPVSFSDPAYDWSGFYLGGHLGYAGGDSHFTGPGGIAGSISLAQPFNAFNEAGSFFAGVQAGYNYMLPNRIVLGAEADASFPAFPNLSGISVGGITTFNSPFGAETYGETMLYSGTLRGRIGYAPGHWLFYATGGFAWSYNQLTLTNAATGTSDMPFLWRLGWTAGAGIETPIAPHWTARLEYLFTDYGNESVLFGNAGQRFTSDFPLQELRAGVNYQFGNGVAPFSSPGGADPDIVNFHGQTTFTWQGYPAIRSPFSGPNSLPASGEGRETIDATLFAGVRLWQGAEFWIDPELDQGFGLGDTHGAAGFTSAEAYKIGAAYPYARVQRYFVRQTIDLGGDSQKVDADLNQFAGSQTANRLVLTVGKFSIVDIFDTNKYANNPKSDFLNWSAINAGTFDYAGDAWGYSYGLAAEWYQGDWTLRGGVFDMSVSPTEAANSAPAYGLDPTFDQFQMVGELEKRYELWGQPGTLKVTGFLTRGRMASFQDAIDLSLATGLDINDATTAVRKYQSRPGVSVNLAQQLTDDVGLFARAGWADGNVEPWDFTDIDRTVEAGLSINGKQWGRPDDTIGIVGIVNNIASVHQAWFNAGGMGILIGDGQLPNPGLEQILETYYSYALTSSTRLTADYQFVENPGYNTDRGPVNVFTGRMHWQF
jgi:high affinity Mn2+ porin